MVIRHRLRAALLAKYVFRSKQGAGEFAGPATSRPGRGLTCRKGVPVPVATVRQHDCRSSFAPGVEAEVAQVMLTGDMTMSLIFRVVFIIAGAVTALFVARDALNFTIIQTFVAVLLVTAVVGAGSLWSLRRKT